MKRAVKLAKLQMHLGVFVIGNRESFGRIALPGHDSVVGAPDRKEAALRGGSP